MYVTGTNCDHDFIVILDRIEFNSLLKHMKEDAFHEGLIEAERIDREQEESE